MFRTSRKSNEARQLLLYRLSSRIRRNVGRKSLEKGGQAVLGYVEAFDLESSSGALIARGFGTACTVHKVRFHLFLRAMALSARALLCTQQSRSHSPRLQFAPD